MRATLVALFCLGIVHLDSSTCHASADSRPDMEQVVDISLQQLLGTPSDYSNLVAQLEADRLRRMLPVQETPATVDNDDDDDDDRPRSRIGRFLLSRPVLRTIFGRR
jgi:hypothetical protein